MFAEHKWISCQICVFFFTQAEKLTLASQEMSLEEKNRESLSAWLLYLFWLEKVILPHNIPKLIVKRTIETVEIEIDYKSNISIKRTWYSSAREN